MPLCYIFRLGMERAARLSLEAANLREPGGEMAFTETYRCDVCAKPRGDAEDWWLAWSEQAAAVPGSAEQALLKFTPWNVLLSHSAEVRHLCGARCAQTLMDRWMRREK